MIVAEPKVATWPVDVRSILGSQRIAITLLGVRHCSFGLIACGSLMIRHGGSATMVAYGGDSPSQVTVFSSSRRG